MADVINDDDEQTLDQSNSGESDDQTDGSVDSSQQDDAASGQAAGDDSSSDDGDDDGSEGGDQKQTRGERRHERYIDKLSAEIRQSNDQSSRYTEELFAPKPYQPLNYKEGEEYDPKQLEEDRQAAIESSRNEGLQTGLRQGTSLLANELWSDRLDIDSERVATRWDALNPDKPESYDEKLEATLVQKYIQFTGMAKQPNGRIIIQRPNVRFKDFVEAEMRERDEYAAKYRETSQRNITRQAAQTGVRPTGQARTSKGGHGFDPNDPVGSVARMSSKQYFELGGKEASDAYLAERGLSSK